VTATRGKPNRLITIDMATNKITGTPVVLAPGPFGLATDENNLVHVSSYHSTSITTVGTTTGLPVDKPIKLPISPRGIGPCGQTSTSTVRLGWRRQSVRCGHPDTDC
jgi:hypothetical protein